MADKRVLITGTMGCLGAWVLRHLVDAETDIQRDGRAPVSIGGREVVVGRRFIEDLDGQDILVADPRPLDQILGNVDLRQIETEADACLN